MIAGRFRHGRVLSRVVHVLDAGCSGRFGRSVEESSRHLLHGLLGEFLEELGAAGQVELADQGGLHAAVAPGLAAAEVLGERLARDVGQIRHRHGLHGARGRVADQRRLEDAGDQRGRRLDQARASSSIWIIWPPIIRTCDVEIWTP